MFSSPVDSEKAARPEADCGICHAGRQGDWLIKMNLMICFIRIKKKRERENKDKSRKGSDHSVPVLMKDHEGMNVAHQLKHCVRLILYKMTSTKCSFNATKLQFMCQFLWD